MKLTVLFILVPLLQVSANVYSQQSKLNVSLRNSSVKDVLKLIEEQSEYYFLYKNEDVDVNRRLDVNVRDESVETLLDRVFNGTGVTYRVSDRQIVLVGNGSGSTKGVFQSAQQKKLTGKIVDQDGNPLPGVTIVVKGTARGTVSDIDGNYTLSVEPDAKSLVFSFVGMKSREVELGSRSVIDVALESESIGLDEVIAVGYGTMKKSDLTGSVASVSSDKLAAFPALGATQAIQGRAAGVVVTSLNGEPGASARIRIRGGTSINASSDPLYVIDGFAGGTAPPPEDIQSIEILKDASATAIYGARGANGVILITTKNGRIGKPLIEFNASYSVQNIGEQYDMLNATEFAEYVNEVYANDYSTTVIYPDPASMGVGTDWQDEVFRTGGLQSYQLSFSGGTEVLKYYSSLNYYDAKGTVINSKYNRVSVLSNLEAKVNKNIRIGTKLYFVRTESDGVRTQETSSGAAGAGVISAALRFEPTQGVYNENGDYTLSEVGDPHDNPVAVAKERENNTVGDRFTGNAFAEITFLKDFRFYTTVGAEIYNERAGTYVPKTLVEGANTGGSASIASKKNTMLLNENYLTWNKTFSDNHTITAMGGYSYQKYRAESWTASNRNFISDSFMYWNLAGGTNYQAGSSGLTEWKLASFYGRLNYAFSSKYLVTFTGRYDGSSRLGANNRWAFFPSGALAWNLKEEGFMDNVPVISHLKARVSHGEIGNTEIDPYSSLAKFSTSLTIINNAVVNAVRPTSVANKDLKWESTRQTDVGIDIGFFKERVRLTADYYSKKTEDLLYQVPLPLYSGFSTMYKNIGSIRNRGFELSISTINFNREFKWNTDFNISFNRNKILHLEGGDVFYSTVPGHLLSTSSQVLRVGEVVGAFYGKIFEGVYQQNDDFSAEPGKKPGDIKYRDFTGRDADGELDGIPNGTVDNDDRAVIGNPHPDFTFGFNNDFRYKNFDLSIFFQGSVGNDILNYTRLELDAMMGKANATTRALNRWTPTNTNTDVPRASATHTYQMSSRWVEDGSYVRLKNIALGYNLPDHLLKRYSITKFRVYVSAQNLLTITDYSGYDPEVGFNNSNRNIGLDYGTYPNVRSWTFGLQVGL